jgi:hypothetical protein
VVFFACLQTFTTVIDYSLHCCETLIERAGFHNGHRLCIMNRPKRVFSNRRDLLVTCLIGRHVNALINLMSIRSTGCQARILIMTEKGHQFDSVFLEMASVLEVEFAYFVFSPALLTDSQRSEWLLEWLSVRVHDFDRIFFFDAYDVFFQSDPFEHLVEPGLMTFVGEGVLLRDQVGNFGAVKDLFGPDVAAAMARYPVLCSGTVAGDPVTFVRYLRVLMRNGTLWRSTFDQTQLNYWAWMGGFEAAGVRFRVEHCNGTINSMYYCPRSKVFFLRDLFDVSENPEFVNNAVMHHYKGWPSIVRNYYKRCGIRPPRQTS